MNDETRQKNIKVVVKEFEGKLVQVKVTDKCECASVPTHFLANGFTCDFCTIKNGIEIEVLREERQSKCPHLSAYGDGNYIVCSQCGLREKWDK